MKINKIIISNFKGIREPISISPALFTCIVGKNDVGKSTILKAIDLFLNDSGKYIVFHVHNPERFKFTDEFIKEFCREYKVTFEGITKELHEDYEGNTQEQLYTYVFEIIKGV